MVCVGVLSSTGRVWPGRGDGYLRGLVGLDWPVCVLAIVFACVFATVLASVFTIVFATAFASVGGLAGLAQLGRVAIENGVLGYGGLCY